MPEEICVIGLARAHKLSRLKTNPKVTVFEKEAEVPRLRSLFERGQRNGLVGLL